MFGVCQLLIPQFTAPCHHQVGGQVPSLPWQHSIPFFSGREGLMGNWVKALCNFCLLCPFSVQHAPSPTSHTGVYPLPTSWSPLGFPAALLGQGDGSRLRSVVYSFVVDKVMPIYIHSRGRVAAVTECMAYKSLRYLLSDPLQEVCQLLL